MLKRHIQDPVFSRNPSKTRSQITGVVEDVDSGLGEGDSAVGITELSHAEKVVGERVHDEAIVGAWWKLW